MPVILGRFCIVADRNSKRRRTGGHENAHSQRPPLGLLQQSPMCPRGCMCTGSGTTRATGEDHTATRAPAAGMASEAPARLVHRQALQNAIPHVTVRLVVVTTCDGAAYAIVACATPNASARSTPRAAPRSTGADVGNERGASASVQQQAHIMRAGLGSVRFSTSAFALTDMRARRRFDLDVQTERRVCCHRTP